ncbi:hypothetical protein BH10BAC5_BH10BAC5_24820 [soil metagenome]
MKEFEIVSNAIKNRRTVKAASMNGKLIPDELIEELLKLADWAPTHGKTEPWRYFVFRGASLKKFGEDHAELYKNNTSSENFKQETYDKLFHAVDKSSHLIAAVMKRGINPKIPKLEEICAASASIENMLIGASALGLSVIWNSGGMTHENPMKKYLGLEEEDVVLGLIYLGYTDMPAKAGTRNIPLEEKVKWME